MKKEVRVVVFRNDSCEYELPSSPIEFLKWWEEKFILIPKEYKDSAKIDCLTLNYPGYAQLKVEIYYYRPETELEEQLRLNKEKQAREFRENQELCELERLRNKYNM